MFIGNQENTMTTKMFAAIVHLKEDMYVMQCPEVGIVNQDETLPLAVIALCQGSNNISRRVNVALGS